MLKPVQPFLLTLAEAVKIAGRKVVESAIHNASCWLRWCQSSRGNVMQKPVWYTDPGWACSPSASVFGTPRIDGAHQSGAQIQTDGWRPGVTLRLGSLVMFAGCYAQTVYGPTDILRQFVVTADAEADAQGHMPLCLYPALRPGKTICELPSDNAMVYILETYQTLY